MIINLGSFFPKPLFDGLCWSTSRKIPNTLEYLIILSQRPYWTKQIRFTGQDQIYMYFFG